MCRFLNELSLVEQGTFVLHFFLGWDVQRISTFRDVSPQSVHRTLKVAQERFDGSSLPCIENLEPEDQAFIGTLRMFWTNQVGDKVLYILLDWSAQDIVDFRNNRVVRGGIFSEISRVNRLFDELFISS